MECPHCTLEEASLYFTGFIISSLTENYSHLSTGQKGRNIFKRLWAKMFSLDCSSRLCW